VIHAEDPRPQVTGDMMDAGIKELVATNLLRPGADQDYARLMVAVSRVFARMRAIEPVRIEPKRLHIIGGIGG